MSIEFSCIGDLCTSDPAVRFTLNVTGNEYKAQQLPTERWDVGSLASLHTIDSSLYIVDAKPELISAQRGLRNSCHLTSGFCAAEHPDVMQEESGGQRASVIPNCCINWFQSLTIPEVPFL